MHRHSRLIRSNPFLDLTTDVYFVATMGKVKAKNPSFSHRIHERGGVQKKNSNASDSQNLKFQCTLALDESNVTCEDRISMHEEQFEINQAAREKGVEEKDLHAQTMSR